MINLTDCEIPVSRLLGEEGMGLRVALSTLDGGRVGIASQAIGIARGAFEAARDYARQRTAFGKAVAEFQAIRFMLADMATEIDAARLLTWRAAFLKDKGVRHSRESAMAKLYASEIAVKAADDCVQIHGGYGFVKDYPAEKYFRDVKLVTIGEGTSEIQRLVIARQLLGQ
jgi:alkylation response protein AidB-like acyl-CoA dehydrogenase